MKEWFLKSEHTFLAQEYVESLPVNVFAKISEEMNGQVDAALKSLDEKARQIRSTIDTQVPLWKINFEFENTYIQKCHR